MPHLQWLYNGSFYIILGIKDEVGVSTSPVANFQRNLLWKKIISKGSKLIIGVGCPPTPLYPKVKVKSSRRRTEAMQQVFHCD